MWWTAERSCTAIHQPPAARVAAITPKSVRFRAVRRGMCGPRPPCRAGKSKGSLPGAGEPLRGLAAPQATHRAPCGRRWGRAAARTRWAPGQLIVRPAGRRPCKPVRLLGRRKAGDIHGLDGDGAPATLAAVDRGGPAPSDEPPTGVRDALVELHPDLHLRLPGGGGVEG